MSRINLTRSTLGDLPIKIIDGDRSAKYPKRDEFQPSGVLFLNTTTIHDDRFDFSEANYVSDEKFAEIKKGRVERLDIVMTTRGSIGKLAQFDLPTTALINAQMLIVRADGRVLDARFLFHLMRGENFQSAIRNFASGSAQPQIPITDLKAVEIAYPPIESQRRIASILSAYDDLIENNTRRIKILEDMAQMLYREWFVNFRLPGHQKVKMVESELGPIPEGWKVRSLRDVTSYISRGISPTYDESAAGWVINQKCIRDRRLNLGPARKQSKPVPPEKAVRKGDILINSTGVGTLGRVAQVHQKLVTFTVDSHVSIVRPTRNADYLGEVALELESSFEAMGVGSTGQTELGRERIAGTLFVCPPDSLQTRYAEYAQGIHQLSLCLLQKNENLCTTRDFLLPKLISGEIPVEAAAELAEQTV